MSLYFGGLAHACPYLGSVNYAGRHVGGDRCRGVRILAAWVMSIPIWGVGYAGHHVGGGAMQGASAFWWLRECLSSRGGSGYAGRHVGGCV